MEITANTKELTKSLEAHKKVTTGQSKYMPILGYMLIKVEEDKISLASTDLDTTLITPLTAKVEEPGQVVVLVDSFLKVLKAVKSDNIALIQREDNKLTLQANKLSVEIVTLPVEDYPALPEFTEDSAIEAISIRAEVLKRINKAVPVKETRYSITGLLLETHNSGADYARFVATDGHRLSIQNCQLDNPPVELTAIIPKKTVNLLSSYKEIAIIAKTENHLKFQADSHFLITKLLEGNFPNYNLPLDVKIHEDVILYKNPLKEAIEQVLPFCDKKSHAIRFELKDGNLKLTSMDSEIGEASTSIPIDSGANITWGMNGSYVLDMLKDMNEELLLGIPRFQSDKPDLLLPFLFVDSEVDYRQVIMPMKL